MLCDHFSILEVSPPLTYSDFHWLQEQNKLSPPLEPRFIQEFKDNLKFRRRSWLALSLRSWLLPVLPRGCLWAPDTRERSPGSCSGPSPRPGAYAADLRGDESCGVPPPRRLPLPVTHRRWGEPHGGMMWLRFVSRVAAHTEMIESNGSACSRLKSLCVITHAF